MKMATFGTHEFNRAALDRANESHHHQLLYFEPTLSAPTATLARDDVLARLLTCPNVLVTAHQTFLTREALHNIAETTLDNLTRFAAGSDLVNELTNLNR